MTKRISSPASGQAPDLSQREPRHVPIVGIGASAGGIEALIKFFDAMPADAGMAFVIVLHLDPTRESQLAAILAQHTDMPVIEIEDGMPIKADHVYVIAPNAYLRVAGAACHLSEPDEPRGHRFPVDELFRSLAEDQLERAICVVLSGTGHNGTEGLKDVRAAGGCAIAQDPKTAKFDGMPRSAIAAGLVDRVLAPEGIPEFLLEYIKQGHSALGAPGAPDAEESDARTSSLPTVLAVLRARADHDFSNYKPSTLTRRINRRMGLVGSASMDDYLGILRDNPEEVSALTSDLMISVTGFFRDPDAWAALEELVIRPLVAERSDRSPIRLWVPACSTGEEAYSLGMLVLDAAEEAGKQFDLKIFATDSQNRNLNTARSGIYPAAASKSIPERRLRRYFDWLDGAIEVHKDLREKVIFSPHNLLQDPPFSRLDLVTCRNLLIYLQPEAQMHVLGLCHFAIRDGGHLFLGNAETVGRSSDLFSTVSAKSRIYRRIGANRHDIVDFPRFTGPAGKKAGMGAEATTFPAPPRGEYADLTRKAVLERHAPASILVDQSGRVLYFHGVTNVFVDTPPGEPTRDVLAMARDGVRAKLRVALRDTTKSGEEQAFTTRLMQNGTPRLFRVTVTPVKGPGDAALRLISFALQHEEPGPLAPPFDKAASHNEQILEDELRAIRAELSSTTEQMESVNEELKAYNEEATSMNEELQSTNEELETSKEELQSFNEELHSVNSQLQHKVQELDEATDNLENLLSGTNLATVFLDTALCVRWFSPASRTLLELVTTDIGRPLAHFALKIADDNLLRDATRVLDKLAPIEAEVPDEAGNWYLRRLQPYRTRENRIDGVVITFTDVTERKRATDAVNEARIYAESIVATIRQPLLVLSSDLHVVTTNDMFYETFESRRQDTEGKLIYDLGNGQWNIPELRTLLEDILPEKEELSDFRVDHEFESLGRRTMLLNARRLRRNGGRPHLILLSIEDTTVRTEADAHRDLLIDELSHRVKNTLATVQSLASQTLRQVNTIDGFKSAFEGRLHALARAHDLLVEEDWKGTGLKRLAHRTLAPYFETDSDRITIDGPSVLLSPQAGTAMALILHELATNATKYGALSTPEGKLALRWRFGVGEESGSVRVDWTETCAHKIEQPTHTGFGSRLIKTSVSHDLHGSAKLDYRTTGLHCEITLPLKPLANG
ncbi:MAG: PAS domain-containing protein [Allgaiera sp.]|jgi:two-component system CheB/CheR fusion protein|nr:PAS domain-containing protein [Allgaiera sp.]